MAIPSGNVVGRSFNECTTKSTQPVDSAISSSLVNKDFSPILGRGMSRTLSPSVLIVTEGKIVGLNLILIILVELISWSKCMKSIPMNYSGVTFC